MALLMPGRSECPICRRTISEEDERFGTWGVFKVAPDLIDYCDAVMHWSCYAPWPRRREFARAYFNFWIGNEPSNRYWAKAYLDERVLVTVNPFISDGGEVELVLAETGSRLRVRAAEWEQWLNAPDTSEGRPLYPLEAEEVRAVVPALKAAIPTVDELMDALDGDSKGWTRRET
jgi:hypothetical protein